jgi:hypothetical protein
MWMLLPRKVQVLIVILLWVMGACTLSAVAGWHSGISPPIYQWVFLGATIITLVCIPVAEKLWRVVWAKIPALNRLIFPDLSGTWTGTLVSTWKSPETGQSPPPIPVTFWITQGVFSITVQMKTGESRSYSRRCLAEADAKAQVFRLWYWYDNRPNAEVSYRSTQHEGAALLELDVGSSPYRLVGQYYTQRKTSGDIRISRTSAKLIEAEQV